MRLSNRCAALLVAGLTFGLYLATSGPSLVPYRDAGEMATSVPMLGILHPTSYPLYSIVGFLFNQLPLANAAYRLNVFSALAMAAVWALLFLIFAARGRRASAFCIVALGALSYHFWWHALVSEMYALNLFFVAALLLAYQRRQLVLWGFLFGLGLANRADLLLTLPAFALGFMLDAEWAAQRNRRTLLTAAACIGVGLLLYMMLPLRAAQQPWMNWDDPSTWERFLRSVLRRGYGGGLDLLSTSYAMGENFTAEMRLYLVHLWRDYAFLGVPLALVGTFTGLRARSAWILLALAGWSITGPLFIFLGNLPPNTHAVAILEAAYLMPDIFFLLLAADGLAALMAWQPGKSATAGAAVFTLGMTAWNAWAVFPQVNQRANFLAVDFCRNTYLSLPAPALVVSRSDVPLFTLYYGHWGPQHIVGRVPVAQGLAGSAWYQTMMQRAEAGLSIVPLRENADWAAFARQNPGWAVYAGQDIEWPTEGLAQFEPRGLVNAYSESKAGAKEIAKASSRMLLENLYVYRNPYIYGHYRDFFSNELIESYAKAWMQIGDESALRMAMAIKPDMPYAPFQLGYLYYARGDYATAARYYAVTLRNFEDMERLADAWKTFPALKKSIQQDHALARTHWNVVQQRLHAQPVKVQ